MSFFNVPDGEWHISGAKDGIFCRRRWDLFFFAVCYHFLNCTVSFLYEMEQFWNLFFWNALVSSNDFCSKNLVIFFITLFLTSNSSNNRFCESSYHSLLLKLIHEFHWFIIMLLLWNIHIHFICNLDNKKYILLIFLQNFWDWKSKFRLLGLVFEIKSFVLFLLLIRYPNISMSTFDFNAVRKWHFSGFNFKYIIILELLVHYIFSNFKFW